MASNDPEPAQLTIAHGTLPPRYEAPTTWAVQHLIDVLASRDITAVESEPMDDTPEGTTSVVLRVPVGDVSDLTASARESFAIDHNADSDPIVISSDDGRGMTYGILELADRAAHSTDPLAAIRGIRSGDHRSATPVRSILRTFACEVQDKEWFYDEEFWNEYLTELATQRINRFQLALGMQYNYSHAPEDARDNYFCFLYPFVVDVPGYNVRARGISSQERERNLRTLRFIGTQAARRGIHFQLGLWNHAYDQGFVGSYPIDGLEPDIHAAYCAAALAQLLRECPDISGLTLRVHYEGGIPEPGHGDFWGPVMDAAATVGRPIELDMHAKGVDQELLDIATGTDMPVVVSAKYWAEHQGLPYHQARIRDKERATKSPGTGLMAITAHERRFTRYGYGDFLKEDRNYDLLFRIWPGTQRVLLWGDPALAAGYGRLGTLGGSVGVELSEPLTFSGRMGSGRPGERDQYLDEELKLGVSAWKKYRYTYRLWGRLLYDPDSDRDEWMRSLRSEFGEAADDVEIALAHASRVLPLVTVVHGIGASNNGYWPEVYLNMPLADGPNAQHYERDTEQPPTLGGVSSFDPEMFYSTDDFVDAALAQRRDGRYTPIETARWLSQLADVTMNAIDAAGAAMGNPKDPQFRRVDVDVRVQAALARFFAAKTLAGVDYSLHARTKDVRYLQTAIAHYETARDAYALAADLTTGVYLPDMTFGTGRSEHGHWADRLPAIDDDVKALRDLAAQRSGDEPVSGNDTIDLHTERGQRAAHQPPASFRPGRPIDIHANVDHAAASFRMRLHYRHLNQGDRWEDIEMRTSGSRYSATIPANYTQTPYPMQYYFSVHTESGRAWMDPGFDSDLANQPYHVIRQASSGSD